MDKQTDGRTDGGADGARWPMNHQAKLALLYKSTDACWCWSGLLLACVRSCVHVSKHRVCTFLFKSVHAYAAMCERIFSHDVCFCSNIWTTALDSVHAHVSICVAALCLFRCVGVLSDQGSVKPGGAQHPHTALKLEQWPLQNKCKQLRATSVSIRQTDSSCEQGLWLIASYQINWTCGASWKDNATRGRHFLDLNGLFCGASLLVEKLILCLCSPNLM